MDFIFIHYYIVQIKIGRPGNTLQTINGQFFIVELIIHSFFKQIPGQFQKPMKKDSFLVKIKTIGLQYLFCFHLVCSCLSITTVCKVAVLNSTFHQPYRQW